MQVRACRTHLLGHFHHCPIMKNKRAAGLAGLIAMAVGIGFIITGSREVIQAHQSSNWSKVEGVITESLVERKRTRADKPKTSRKPKVTYQYTVGDSTFTGDRPICGTTINLAARFGLTRSAEQVVRQYPKGSTVDVFHHPDDPKVAVLETGIKGETLVPVVFGLIFLSAGLFVMLKKK